MKLIVNGEEKVFDGELTVSELLVEQNVAMPEMVSVELNDEILDRDRFGETTLHDGDRIEFLYFMGGGASASPEAAPSIVTRFACANRAANGCALG